MNLKSYPLSISIALGILLGASAMWGYQSYNEEAVIADEEFLNDVFDDQFFKRSHSPFEEMDRIHERMNRAFGDHSRFPDFDSWFDGRYGDFPLAKIRSEEDKEHLYYVLDIEGKEVANVQVETADGYVSITAELKTNIENMSSSTQIDQRFPIPANVDANSVHIEQLDDEIRVRFTKTH